MRDREEVTVAVARRPVAAPMRRLASLAALDRAALAALQSALAQTVTVATRRDLMTEGRAIGEPRLIVDGWAVRVRLLADGRRQFLSFLLPGDFVGLCSQPEPLAVSTVTTLTPVLVCPAPAPSVSPALAEAYALSQALDEAYLLEQIARLGRLNAQERIFSLFLELDERLGLSGLSTSGIMDLPLTQEQLADALGLTSVHVNRMLQQARRDGALTLNGRRLAIRQPAELARKVGRNPIRVSARQVG